MVPVMHMLLFEILEGDWVLKEKQFCKEGALRLNL